jgi:hypothetical protein
MVEAVRVNDTMYSILLPDTLPAGEYALHAAVIESPDFSASVEVAGWLDTRTVTLAENSRFSTAWPAGSPTGLLVVVNDTVRFVRATTGAVTTLPIATTTYRVPLGSDGAGHLLAPQDPDTLTSWSVDVDGGTATVAGKLPSVTDADNSYYRFSGAGSVFTNHNLIYFEPGPLRDISYITSPRPVTSVAAGRTIIPYRLMTSDPGGIPILRTDSGSVGALVTGYSRLDAARFDAAGTTLFLAASTGGVASTSQSLLKVDPMTGTILDSVPSDSGPRAEDLWIEAGHGWLVEAVRDTARWTVRVRDAATLHLLAQFRSPFSLDGCRAEGELHLLPAPVAGEFYLASAACTGGGGEVHFARFSFK